MIVRRRLLTQQPGSLNSPERAAYHLFDSSLRVLGLGNIRIEYAVRVLVHRLVQVALLQGARPQLNVSVAGRQVEVDGLVDRGCALHRGARVGVQRNALAKLGQGSVSAASSREVVVTRTDCILLGLMNFSHFFELIFRCLL